MRYKTLDLFTGAGGIHLALKATGLYNTLGFSEIDPHACATLSRRFRGIPNYGDVRGLGADHVAGIDIIAGGFPCQDISVGGGAEGLSGKRSGLWYEMLRLIELGKPKGVLIENVDQLRTRGLGAVLRGLADIGYDAEWYTIPASAIGAPHRRKRLYIIAYRYQPRKPGLVSPFCLSLDDRSWQWAGAADLQEIYNNPFLPGPRWPQPLLRRMDDGLANRAHRLVQIGNGVVVPVVTQIAELLHRRICESEE